MSLSSPVTVSVIVITSNRTIVFNLQYRELIKDFIQGPPVKPDVF